MTHTPVLSVMLDDFNTMVNVEELEPIDGIEMKKIIYSIINFDELEFDDEDDFEDIDHEVIF